jgi:hypothetical protein
MMWLFRRGLFPSGLRGWLSLQTAMATAASNAKGRDQEPGTRLRREDPTSFGLTFTEFLTAGDEGTTDGRRPGR